MANVHTGAPASAQITICGELKATTLAAIAELALEAGAAVLLQPRALPALVPPGQASAPLALPPGGAASRKVAVQEDKARRALQAGPLLVAEFVAATGLNKRQALALAEAGVIVAFGKSRGRRYCLPGREPQGRGGL